MSSRNQILEAIKNAQPAIKPLPVLDYTAVTPIKELISSFEQFVNAVGGRVRFVDQSAELTLEIENARQEGRLILNRLNGFSSMDEISPDLNELEKLDRVYVRGSLGVAENGAIWVEETSMGNRILPFIAQELVIVLREEELVPTMHDAYQRIRINQEGFGVFIAGPSKTADIEQSLVIGAHGPVALTVLILKSGLAVPA
ncbi:LUD domain-containing protein [Flavihumibacter sp. RY-1]|uniref:LUD domain-containing protein n=1 Tax=Flavihumibacter fluminis TaxID=2909236 RepID=A0ABS9BL77_9BACT|nr:LUD domain-containing protein [Flavihumibacter fluminis]MCF1715763.1 LUD domain-containing protein [Flavihumibacter fluminis]